MRDATAALERMGRSGLLEGLESVEIFGSFASDVDAPNDIDLMLHFDSPARSSEVAEQLGTVSAWEDGRITLMVIEPGPEGDAFRTEYRTETRRRHGVGTVRVA